MLAISLVFVGITLVINGLYTCFSLGDKKNLVVLNLWTGFLVVIFNLYLIFTNPAPQQMIGYFGGLLFGVTNLLIAFDFCFNLAPTTTGIYCALCFFCACFIGVYDIINKLTIKGIFWCLWSLIWLFAFIAFAITPKFCKASGAMFIIQGILTTFMLGLLILFGIFVF